ncbi:MAG: hypothetical protein ACHQ1H_10695 [Nitrososphaerales archaeon]
MSSKPIKLNKAPYTTKIVKAYDFMLLVTNFDSSFSPETKHALPKKEESRYCSERIADFKRMPKVSSENLIKISDASRISKNRQNPQRHTLPRSPKLKTIGAGKRDDGLIIEISLKRIPQSS